MPRLFCLVIAAILLYGLATFDLSAIPKPGDKIPAEDDMDILDHYPSREPTTADEHYALGLIYMRRGMLQMASQQFKKALELDPKHVYSLIGLMNNALRIGDMETAAEYSNKATGLKPDSPEVHSALGEVWMLNAPPLANLDKAETEFKKAISLNTRFLPAHMNLAAIYMFKGELEKSIKEYEVIIKVEPENLAALKGISTAYINVGSFDKALEIAIRVAELSPQDPVSHRGLGEVYKHQGQLDKALVELQQAIELDPNHAPAYKNIGDVYYMRDLLDKAVEEYQKALSISPNYGEAYAALGDTYWAKGMLQKAMEEYKKALGERTVRTLPLHAFVFVHNNLAYLYAEDGQDLDEALSLVQKARQMLPEHPGIADTMGWIYCKKGLYHEAVINLEAAAKGLPDNPAVRYHLGVAYYNQGDKQKAAAELKKALSMDSSFEGSEDAKRILAELESK